MIFITTTVWPPTEHLDNSSDVEDGEIQGPGSVGVETRMWLVREIIPNKHGGK